MGNCKTVAYCPLTDGELRDCVRKYREKPSPELLQRAFEALQPLARSVIRRNGMPLSWRDDAEQEAFLLLERMLAETFQLERTTPFLPYFKNSLRLRLIRFFHRQRSVVTASWRCASDREKRPALCEGLSFQRLAQLVPTDGDVGYRDDTEEARWFHRWLQEQQQQGGEPDRAMQALLLFLQGKTYCEIGRELGVCRTTAKHVLDGAYTRLRAARLWAIRAEGLRSALPLPSLDDVETSARKRAG